MNDIGRDVATLNFMGIENIHSVRDSLAAYCSASQAQGQEFYHAVGASGWLRHLSQVLLGAMVLVGGGGGGGTGDHDGSCVVVVVLSLHGFLGFALGLFCSLGFIWVLVLRVVAHLFRGSARHAVRSKKVLVYMTFLFLFVA